MKKLKEIRFNHELIGKDGIVIKYRNEEIPSQIVLVQKKLELNNSYPIFSFNYEGATITHDKKGERYTKEKSEHDLIMYEEVEVKEPRVIWANIYQNGAFAAHSTKEDAEKYKSQECVKTVKFIEVIEEGE